MKAADTPSESQTTPRFVPTEEREFVRVVPVSGGGRIGTSLTYRVPEHLRDIIAIGSIVAVEVRRTHLVGVATSFEEKDERLEASPYAIKDIRALYTDETLLTTRDVEMARWIAGYYTCSLRDALSPFAPEVRALQATTVLVASVPDAFYEAMNSLGLLFSRKDAVPVEERPDGTVRISGTELVEALCGGGVTKDAAEATVRSWTASGILHTEIGIRTRIRHLGRSSWLTLTQDGRDADWGKIRSERQRRVLELLENVGGILSKEELVREVPGAQSAVRVLVGKDFIEEIVDSSLLPPEGPRESLVTLSDSQRGAVESITRAMEEGESRTFLLFGVTSSGKTEVYLEICRRAIEAGKRATILVPEIALTYQTVQRFIQTFPRRIALLHSELTDRERLHEWRAVRRGERDIVIGARSALFAPMDRRGVIVIDEESETAYKQQQRPRYHAREVARRMARAEGSVLVLGSATPSVESFHAAKKGTYTLLRLPARVVGGALPEVQLVRPDVSPAKTKDERETVEVDGRDMTLSLMSSVMREELGRTLAMHRQALLFLNLRGFSQSLICPSCGWVPMCPNCEVSLTYHRRERSQMCHHCGHHEQAVDSCRRCGERQMKFLGWGTERLETEVRAIHPSARILRMDRDSVSSRGRRRTIVDAVRRHEVDILLGTQMIAKGLDFPSVRLVGVISADQSLHVPDFRAAERTFQLLTQVIGRAGRSQAVESEGGGVAVIQTYDPHSRVLMDACRQDFESFYNSEIVLRERFGYPPAVHLARVVFSGADRDTVAETASRFGLFLEKNARGTDASVLGPAPAPYEKLEGKWRYHCILKAPRVSGMASLLRSTHRATRLPRGVRMEIDIDPLAML